MGTAVMKIVLILAVILIPLCYALYYFGFFVPRAGFSIFRASCSLPTRWEGKFLDTSGCMCRNFVVFKKHSKLAIAFETASGTIEFEVNGPDGSSLSPASGVWGRDAFVLIDVSRLKRCSVSLRMDRFCGNFQITLQ